MKMSIARPLPADIVHAGRRVQVRSALRLPATLLSDTANCDAIVTDLNTDGCRLETGSTAPVDSAVTIVISRSTLIGGRIAWRDGDAVGIAFCARLLPRAIAQALQSGAGAD